MRRIIFQAEGSNFTVFILSSTLGLLTVFLTGYLSVNLSPAVCISIIAAMAVVAITALLLKNIAMAVPILIMSIPVDRLATFLVRIDSKSKLPWVIFNTIDIISALAVICLLFYRSAIKGEADIVKGKTRATFTGLLFSILITYGLLSVSWSPDNGLGINSGIKLFTNLCIYMTFFHLIKSEEHIIRAVRTLILTAVMTAVVMLVSTLPIDALNIKKIYSLTNELYANFAFDTYQLRASGTIDTHHAGIFLGFGVLFSMGLLSRSSEKKEKVLLFMVIVFLSWAALYTKAKGPLGALLVAVVFLIFAIKDFRAYFFRNLYISVFCFIFLFGVFKITHSYLIDYIKPFLPPGSYTGEHSFSDRIEYWKTAYNALTDNAAYFHGLGLGGSSYYLFPAGHTHNIYLSVFFDIGLLGFGMFSMLLIVSLVRLFSMIKTLKEGFAKAMLLSTLGCIILLGIASVTDFSFNLSLLWLLMGIGSAIYRHALLIQEERFA